MRKQGKQQKNCLEEIVVSDKNAAYWLLYQVKIFIYVWTNFYTSEVCNKLYK